MYKLAKIEHYRCDQPAGKWGLTTYVWVPEGWYPETLQKFVDEAVKSYLNTEAEFKKMASVPAPGYGASITTATPDTMTVGELRHEHQTALSAYAVYTDMLKASRHQFAWHLKEVSGGAVCQFWEKEPDMIAEANWGHNHGVTIEHSETNFKDYPPVNPDEESF